MRNLYICLIEQSILCFRSTESKRLLVARQPAPRHDPRRGIEQHQCFHQPVVFAERGPLFVGPATWVSRTQLKYDSGRGEGRCSTHLP
jgi:hypothetical protein